MTKKIKPVKTASAAVAKEWLAVQAECRKYASKPNSQAYKAAFKKLQKTLKKMCEEARKNA